MDNPNVTIQYFDNNKILENVDSNYFLGYSLNAPLTLKHKSEIEITDTAHNFDGTMNLYLNENDTTKYIFIKAKKTSKQQQYFIGRIR